MGRPEEREISKFRLKKRRLEKKLSKLVVTADQQNRYKELSKEIDRLQKMIDELNE